MTYQNESTMQDIISKVNISGCWDLKERKEGFFTGDQVIDAYLKGKRDGLKTYRKAMLNNLDKNVNECAKHTYAVIEHLKEKKMGQTSAFLKIDSWNNFHVLIGVKETDFLNPDFLKVYDYVSALEEEISTDTLKVDFSFLDFVDEINEKRIGSDGFVLKLKERI